MIIKDNKGRQVNLAELDPSDMMLTMAIGIVSERIRSLPQDDRADLFELLKIASDTCADNEEQDSARSAMMEILDDGSGSVEHLADPVEVSQWAQHVGKTIKELREGRGWNQEELASRADLSSQSYVSRIESGKHSPSYLTIEKLAKALDVQPQRIDPCFGDDEEK